jgi:crotonobetainyl-CoA hydratase
MFDLDKPLIAAVNGITVGGRFEIALACDLIIAVEHAEFFLPRIKIGSFPMPAACNGCRGACPQHRHGYAANRPEAGAPPALHGAWSTAW